MRAGSKILPSTVKAYSCQCPATLFCGSVAPKTSVRRPVISLSRIASSGGFGSAAGSFIDSGSPATTTRANGPVGDG